MVLICDKTWQTIATFHQAGRNEKCFNVESLVHPLVLTITNIKLLLHIDELYQYGQQRMAG